MVSPSPLIMLINAVKIDDENLLIEAMSKIEHFLCKTGVIQRAASLDKIIKHVLDACPDLVSMPETKGGCLPLHVASSLGNVKVVQVILSKYPEATSIPNKKGKLPIHYAVREGRDEVCRLLLTADPKTAFSVTSKLKLPLHYAVSEGYREISKYLLQHNPHGLHAETSKGKIPLHFASRWGHVELTDHFLNLCPNLAKCLDWEQQLPLHEAAREGQTEVAKRLIRIYPDGLKQKNIFNELPLFAAVRFGSKELVAEMIRWFPASGKTVLEEAISNDQVQNWDWDILELCLRGAVGKLNAHEFVPLSKIQFPKEDQAETSILTHQNAKKIPRIHRCICQPFRTMAIKVTPEETEMTNSQALSSSSSSSNVKITISASACSYVNGLINYIPDFEAKRRLLGYSFETENHQVLQREFIPLHAAVESSSSLPVFHRLAAHHADQAAVQDSLGMLPLHIAACHANDKRGIAVMNHLLEINPDGAFVKDSMGRLPLHLALMNKAHSSVVMSLLKINESAGFIPCGTKDQFKESIPLYIATSHHCDVDVVYLLLRGNPAPVHDLIFHDMY